MTSEINLDGDPIRYPLVSVQYRTKRFGPLSVSLLRILAGGDGYFNSGSISDHMNRLLNLKTPFTGPEGYEIGHWERKFAVLDDPAYETLALEAIAADPPSEDSFYAWLHSQEWDYKPTLVIYSNSEFKAVFLDACMNLCREYKHLESEYIKALGEVGLLQK